MQPVVRDEANQPQDGAQGARRQGSEEEPDGPVALEYADRLWDAYFDAFGY